MNPPYDKMTRDENLYIDFRNRRYIIETRDPLPGGFVFGGKQVITGNQGFFVNPRDKTIGPAQPDELQQHRYCSPASSSLPDRSL